MDYGSWDTGAVMTTPEIPTFGGDTGAFTSTGGMDSFIKDGGLSETFGKIVDGVDSYDFQVSGQQLITDGLFTTEDYGQLDIGNMNLDAYGLGDYNNLFSSGSIIENLQSGVSDVLTDTLDEIFADNGINEDIDRLIDSGAVEFDSVDDSGFKKDFYGIRMEIDKRFKSYSPDALDELAMSYVKGDMSIEAMSEAVISARELYGDDTKIASLVQETNGMYSYTVDAGISWSAVVNIGLMVMTGGLSTALTSLKGLATLSNTMAGVLDKQAIIDINKHTSFGVSPFANMADRIGEALGVNKGAGLTVEQMKAITAFETVNNAYGQMNGLMAGTELFSSEKVGNVGRTVGAGLMYVSGNAVIESIDILGNIYGAGSGVVDSMYRDGWYDMQDRLGGVLDTVTDVQNKHNDDIKKKLIDALRAQMSNAYEEIDIRQIKQMTMDNVGIMAGSRKWNAQYGGNPSFNPLGGLVPKAFDSGTEGLSKHAGYWVKHVVAVTDIHSSKFNQLAGNGNFTEITFTGFSM